MIIRANLFMMRYPSIDTAGCEDECPESLYNEGKYEAAGAKFIERSRMHELMLRQEDLGVSKNSRNQAGNKAINDLFSATECLKKIDGDVAKIRLYQKKITELAEYQIRIPIDQKDRISSTYKKMVSALMHFRSAELNRINDNSEYISSYNNLINSISQLESHLYTTASDMIPEIKNLISTYDKNKTDINSYLLLAAPGTTIAKTESNLSDIVFAPLAASVANFTIKLSRIQSNITYETETLQLGQKELELVQTVKSQQNVLHDFFHEPVPKFQ